LYFSKPLPVGQEGIKAEEPTSDKIQTAINQKLGIRLPLFFYYLGNHYLWEKKRNLVVEWMLKEIYNQTLEGACL
jgi:hypothetical protein